MSVFNRLSPVVVSLALLPASLPAQVESLSGSITLPGMKPDGAIVYMIAKDNPPQSATSGSVVIDQRNLRFVPRSVLVMPGQEVEFSNSDPLLHNVFSPDGPGEAFDLGTYPAGESRSHTFDRQGSHVILCHVHPEMEAYVMVAPTIHWALTDSDGSFRIDGLPTGSYTLHVWHPRAVPFERALELPFNSRTLSLRLDRIEVR